LVSVDETQLQARPYKAVSGRFLGPIAAQHTADKLPVTRSLIRHDSEAVASAIIGLYNTLNGR